MKSVFSKGYLSGLGIYAVCTVLATAPLFKPSLSLATAERLAAVAIIASLLVALFKALELDTRWRDPDAAFTQALLGIGVCAGLYGALDPNARPQVMVMSLLWVAVGLTHLTPRQVLTLAGLYFGIYAYFEMPTFLGTGQEAFSDALYTLMIGAVVSGFMYMRAHDYEVVRNRSRTQSESLAEAETRIHEFTTQDSETTALKFAYFRNELVKQKALVDSEGGTFSVGLIEIDRYDEMVSMLGDAAASQVMRAFTERAQDLIRRMDTQGQWGKDYKPLGRISKGRFGLVLPSTDFAGAIKCAERLHAALEFKSIRTNAGLVGLTLSIGVTEYAKREDVDELMELGARALAQAQSHNGNDFKGLKRPSSGVMPTQTGLAAWTSAVSLSNGAATRTH
ncbi:MAG TPA: GGDEF domain-containing protein [Gammaproteobacteria bacterium]|nr:GGDEF domain-containing protein [Gammaproteobacteria bacterium]